MPPLRRLALPLLVPVLLAAGSLAGAGPAAADVTGGTSSEDVVLYDHCQQHPITYDLLVSPGTAFWRLEVQVFHPDGSTSEGSVATSLTSPTSGTVNISFCGSEDPGTYTVRGVGFYQILPGAQIPFALPDTTFVARPMATRTALAQKPLGQGRYRLTTSVRQQAEQGYERGNGIGVRLQRLADGHWKRIRGLTLTTVHGRATAEITGRPGSRVRAVVPARSNHAASVSKPVTLGG